MRISREDNRTEREVELVKRTLFRFALVGMTVLELQPLNAVDTNISQADQNWLKLVHKHTTQKLATLRDRGLLVQKAGRSSN
jgi:hypothetical protein